MQYLRHLYMKITFNPAIKNQQTHFNKSNKNTAVQIQTQSNLSGLECVGNYNLFFGRNPKPIYSIDYDGNYEKFESVQAAINKHSTVVSRILGGEISASNNKTYVYADCIELSNGEVSTDELYKTLLVFRDANSQPIYSVDYFGNIKRYNSIKDASISLGIADSNISRVLNQINITIRGYVFISAFDVEMRDKNGKLLRDENDKPVVDTKAIDKVRENFLKIGKNYSIVRIDKDGNVTRFKNIKEASENSSNSAYAIRQSLTENAKYPKNYAYVRLSDVVLLNKFGDVVYDENNDFAIDYKKIERIRQQYFN